MSPGAERQGARWLVRDLLCLLVAAALAWGHYLYARILPTPALLAVWGLFTLLIAIALWRRAKTRRRAFLSVYVAAESPFQRWLRGGFLLALRPALIGTALALVLMVALARIDDVRVWAALITAGPAIVLLRAFFHQRLAAHAGALYLPILSWRLAAGLVGGLLIVMFLVLAWYQSYPDFSGVSLERAVWHLVDQQHARSPAAEFLLQAAAVKDALRLWLAQQLMPAPATSLVHLLGWLLILAEEVLFVWSYLLLGHGLLIGAGTIDRVDHIDR